MSANTFYLVTRTNSRLHRERAHSIARSGYIFLVGQVGSLSSAWHEHWEIISQAAMLGLCACIKRVSANKWWSLRGAIDGFAGEAASSSTLD